MTDTTTSAPPPTESSESSAPASLVDATKKASLLRQIEYYFSDVSFPYDEFLSSQKDEAGSVAVAVLAGSPRIVSMTPDLTPQQREAVLLAVVTESEDVKVVGERIARVWPLPADDPKADHSVYLSGVPKSADEAALRSMLEGCRPSFGRAVSIRRLRDVQRDRAYSGQIFVECEDAEKAATLVRAATKGACGISCNKARLLRDFFDKQDVTIREQKEKRAAKLAAGGGTSSSATSGTKRPAEGEAGEAEPETAEQAAARELKEEKEQALLVRFQKAGPSTDRETLEVICGAYGKVWPLLPDLASWHPAPTPYLPPIPPATRPACHPSRLLPDTDPKRPRTGGFRGLPAGRHRRHRSL